MKLFCLPEIRLVPPSTEQDSVVRRESALTAACACFGGAIGGFLWKYNGVGFGFLLLGVSAYHLFNKTDLVDRQYPRAGL